MGTTIQRTQTRGYNGALLDLRPTYNERVVWQLFDDYAVDKSGFWINGQSRFGINTGASDAIAPFRLLDRCGDRLFAPDPIQLRHPFLVNDSITGKSVWCFGAGGSSPNALSNSANGALYTPSMLTAAGVEINAMPMIEPGGFSFAAKVRVPTPSTTANGISFGATTGGAIFGGRASSIADCMLVSVQQTVGQFQARTRETGGSGIAPSGDIRDGLWHDLVVTYDPGTTTLKGWLDGTLVATNSSASTDVSTADGANLPMIGAISTDGGAGPSTRFGGFIAAAFYLPTSVLNSDAARAAVRTLMADY